MRTTTQTAVGILLVGGLFTLAGCGGGPSNKSEAADKPKTSPTAASASARPAGAKQTTAANTPKNGKTGLPAASISSASIADEKPPEAPDEALPAEESETSTDVQIAEPVKGSAEWLVREAAQVRISSSPKTDDVEILRNDRKRRNTKIIDLAQKAIALCHDKEDKEPVFQMAARQLMDARLEMAMMGEAEAIDAFYDDANALIARAPQSRAAANASYLMVSLAYGHARRATTGDVRWLKEFAKQAASFAVAYPKEESRSLPMVFTAARSCELSGLQPEALECYTVIQKSFPKSTYAPRVTAIIRRLKLSGNVPQLAGPTLGGEQFTLDDMLGKVVVVVFWSAEVKPFQEQLPKLIALNKKHASAGCVVVGVNLDKEPETVNTFCAKHKLAWPQIFFPDEARRGWGNPIVNYYGIQEVPAYWVVDQNGAVVSTGLNADQLEPAVNELLHPGAATE